MQIYVINKLFRFIPALAISLLAAGVARADDPCNGVFKGQLNDGNTLKLTLTANGANLGVRMVINRDPAEYGRGACYANGAEANLSFIVGGLHARAWSNGTEINGQTADGREFTIYRE